MIDFFFSATNAAFSGAAIFAIALVAIELTGFSLHSIGADLHPGADTDTPDGLLSWFGVGRAPLIVVIQGFCTNYALLGFITQVALKSITGSYLTGGLLPIVAIAPALLLTRSLAAFIASVLPKDESFVVSERDYIGGRATITLGIATDEQPAEARVILPNDLVYVQVLAESPDFAFQEGAMVSLTGKKGPFYTALPVAAAKQD